jgi:hypothetical protein
VHHGFRFLHLIDDRPIDLQAVQLAEDLTVRYHFFVGRFRYPSTFLEKVRGPDEGYLIYLKPSLTRDVEHDLWRQFRESPPFPHDPTLNQLYDEDKVESYRQLGFHIGEKLCARLFPGELWQVDQRLAVVDDLFQRCLFHTSGDLWERELEQALEVSNEVADRRVALARQVQRLIARATAVRAWPTEQAMQRVTPGQLVEGAVGCNVGARQALADEPINWEPGGQVRLRRLALGFAQLFDLSVNDQFQNWKGYLASLGQLAVSVSSGVFRDAGAESARDLALCLLGNAAFRLSRTQPSIAPRAAFPILWRLP